MSHAKLSPSAAHRWIPCPGSIALTKDMPDTAGPDARLGTFLHGVAATLLEQNEKHAKTALGLRGRVDNEEFVVTAEMVPWLQTYIAAVRRTVLVEEGVLVVERKVVITEDLWGTPDAQVWSGDGKTLHIFDLKMGAGVLVEALENAQMMTYAAGALNAPAPPGVPMECETVVLHIVQPRRPDLDSAERVWSLSVEQLDEWVNETLLPAAKLARSENAPLQPGEHCRFCKAKATCPKLREEAVNTAVAVFPALDPEKPVAPPLLVNMTNEQLGRVLTGAAAAESWIDAVRKEAAQRIQQGTEVPGWKLVARLGNRRWLDEGSVAAQLQAAGVDPWKPRELLSPAQAEKLLGRPGKKLIEPLTVRPTTGTTLAPASDRRPSISMANVFGDLGEAPLFDG